MRNVPNESVAHVERAPSRARAPGAYTVDMWRVARRHWTAAGVLAALALAVLCPRLGAPGGNYPLCMLSALHTEFSACVPLCYVYYCAGRRRSACALAGAARAHARLLAASVAHAHVVAPALCAALAYALRDAADLGAVRGVLLWSRGGGCAWLSLALSEHAAAPAAAALVWIAALPAAPLATALLCERAVLPSPWSVLLTLGTAAAPFAAGLWRGAAPAGGGARLRLCALALLYAELCAGLQAAAGVLNAADVLAPLALALLALGALAAAAALWERAGVLAPGAARVLALVALPRAPDPRA